jgi:xanthine dehydrogenase accessory factor
MKNIYLQLIENQSTGKAPVLATVIRTKGSTPQKPGSSALFNNNGLIAGTVGGGAVEGQITRLATESWSSAKSGFFEFNLANDISRKDEAICGGQISILVDAGTERHRHVFEKLKQSVEMKMPGVLITLVNCGKNNQVSINRFWSDGKSFPDLSETLSEKISSEVKNLIECADPTLFREIELSTQGGTENSFVLLEPVFPPLKLVIAGAGHIGKSLSHIGSRLGFEVIVIDDRYEYANTDNIPDANRIIVEDVGKAIRELKKGSDTYMVIVTRGHKDDAMALKECIGKGLAYTGMIGSRRKIAAVRDEFISNGWATAEQWAEVYMPIGILEINAQTVEEIAVSIAAQLIMVKNQKKKKNPGCPA